jgi:hypothetical protein
MVSGSAVAAVMVVPPGAAKANIRRTASRSGPAISSALHPAAALSKDAP